MKGRDYLNDESSTADLLQQKWRDEECPIINGVTLGTGGVYLMSLSRVGNQDGFAVTVRPTGVTNLASLHKENGVEWTYLTRLCEFRSLEKGVRVSGGEGGQGADGFVAVSAIEDDRLLWVAFFDNSNPFVEIELTGSQIHAVTTLDDRWSFDLAQPGEVSARAGDPRGRRI